MKPFNKHIAFIICILIYSSLTFARNNQPFPKIQKILLLLPNDTASLPAKEKNNLLSYKKVLEVQGLVLEESSVSQLKENQLSSFHLVILPSSSIKCLSEKWIKQFIGYLKRGGNIVSEGNTAISSLLTIKYDESSIPVSKILDLHYAENKLFWINKTDLFPINNAIKKDTVLVVDEKTRKPIVVSGKYGLGRYIMLSTFFDPNTPKGYSRFPFFIEWLEEFLEVKRMKSRVASEMYFDPGMRDYHPYSTDSLAATWRYKKIKRIYAAGWYYDTDYDYSSLIKACHSNGIQVYCWLELPEVNDTFWASHPNWREKTATGRDAAIDWRKLMNLADDSCRNEVIKELNGLLLKLDWDGVNFAEMYFEPHPAGFENPNNFTPMNQIIRSSFKDQNGFDPFLLFDSNSEHFWKKNKQSWRLFAEYRKKLSYQIKCQFLDFLSIVKKQKQGFEVMLTGIDVSLRPEEADNIGESTELTLELYKKYPMTLQIEDPSNCWGTGPERYEQLGRLYRQTVVDNNRLVFDCNVVGSHEEGFGGFPSEKPSGEEIRQITYNIATHQVRPAFYAEDAVNPLDFINISTVLAREAKIYNISENQWGINSSYSFFLQIGDNLDKVLLDSKPWNANNGREVLIPAGQHTLTLNSKEIPKIKYQIKHFNGELISADFNSEELTFSYIEDSSSAYIILNKKPESIRIDDQSIPNLPLAGNEVSLKLPQGKHYVTIK